MNIEKEPATRVQIVDEDFFISHITLWRVVDPANLPHANGNWKGSLTLDLQSFWKMEFLNPSQLYLSTFIWFQAFISDTNDFQVDLQSYPNRYHNSWRGWFGLVSFVNWLINLRGLLNAKANLLIEQQWYLGG